MGTQPQPKIRFPKWSVRHGSARVLLLSAAVVLALLTGGVLVSQRVILAGDSSAKYPAAKATYMARYQQAQATAQAKYPTASKGGPTIYTPSSPQPTPTFQAGIVDTHEGPFPACDLTVRNAWQGQVSGVWELVYAGVVYSDKAMCTGGQGGLRIYNRVSTASLGTFLAPAGTSALTITAVNGVVMQLRSDTGQILTFNLQTHQYAAG
ncbi:MAG: hypothetical protein OJF49_001378 [Ktedonobacterales bacterium]|jgi:hypothetical protein|nr:MAG: hypothetical protein OJF49_001378 [Ktedonobacterales bacterium]